MRKRRETGKGDEGATNCVCLMGRQSSAATNCFAMGSNSTKARRKTTDGEQQNGERENEARRTRSIIHKHHDGFAFVLRVTTDHRVQPVWVAGRDNELQAVACMHACMRIPSARKRGKSFSSRAPLLKKGRTNKLGSKRTSEQSKKRKEE